MKLPMVRAGSGVYFGGKYCRDYIPEPFTLLSSGMVETEEAERAFSDLVGEDLELFLNTAQICIEEDDLDGYGASVLHWFVNGIASYKYFDHHAFAERENMCCGERSG